ncbi:hypothetical protein C8R47DRAFT_1062706 [Mycena vitilis]|nr:hypothetical protein C8R47DRAFT_1062706 [Mycena vitilis]
MSGLSQANTDRFDLRLRDHDRGKFPHLPPSGPQSARKRIIHADGKKVVNLEPRFERETAWPGHETNQQKYLLITAEAWADLGLLFCSSAVLECIQLDCRASQASTANPDGCAIAGSLLDSYLLVSWENFYGTSPTSAGTARAQYCQHNYHGRGGSIFLATSAGGNYSRIHGKAEKPAGCVNSPATRRMIIAPPQRSKLLSVAAGFEPGTGWARLARGEIDVASQVESGPGHLATRRLSPTFNFKFQAEGTGITASRALSASFPISQTRPRNTNMFCRNGVEDEVHALFDCAGEAQLIDLRARALACSDGAVWELYTMIPNYKFMLKLVASRKAVQLFAKFIFLVLELFQTAPRFFPVVFRTLEQ